MHPEKGAQMILRFGKNPNQVNLSGKAHGAMAGAPTEWTVLLLIPTKAGMAH